MEVLAPCGNFNMIRAAVSHGANAVYFGMSNFNARKSAENFTEENFESVIRYCHLRGVKAYITLNTLIFNDEIDEYLNTLNFVMSHGADAVIVQDISVVKLIRQYNPDFPIHLSTQCGVCSVDGAKFAKEMGATRVVLARETSFEEMKRIKESVDIELEVFVLGALCVSYSGNCYFSSIVDGNSGNRGMCAQPCRKIYSLCSDGFEVKNRYLLSTADICLSEKIDLLKSIGIDSLKIEGRLKRPEYVAAGVKLIKNAVLGTPTSNVEVKKIYNRGEFDEGYGESRKAQVIYNQTQNHIGVKIGEIISVNGGRATVRATYRPNNGDGFKCLRNGYDACGGLFDDSCKQGVGQFEILAQNAMRGDEVRLTSDAKLSQALLDFDDRIALEIFYRFNLDKTYLRAKVFGKVIEYGSEIRCQSAKNSPLSKEEVSNQLSKLNDTNFFAQSISGELSDGLFLAKSQLNQIRREFISYVEAELLPQGKQVVSVKFNYPPVKAECANKELYIVNEHNYRMFDGVTVFKPSVYSIDVCKKYCAECIKEKYLYIFPFMSHDDFLLVQSILDVCNFDGLYIDGVNGYMLAKENNLKVIFGTNANIVNAIDEDNLKELGADFVYSKELSKSELSSLSRQGYLLSRGEFINMTLVHCPLKNNGVCDCSSCKYSDGIYYSDEMGRRFKLHRNKLSACIFALSNILPIDIAGEANRYSRLFDYSCYPAEETLTIIDNGYIESSKGHFKRGIK